MAKRRRNFEDPEINITPMLDIVFIMLIFFVVTTSFTRETGATIMKPSAKQADPLRSGTILVAVQANDEIWMAKRRVELHQVRPMIERAKAENPEGGVVIVADRGARVGTVSQVVDQAKLAGVEGVSISAVRPDD